MFSVVIPLYNKSLTIEKTISSVLAQTYKDFEIVIVNDGSTDDSIGVINRFTNDPRIKIFHQKNQGVSAARNRGVAESKYEYIAFIDGDDEWKAGFLQKMKEAIEKFPNAGMYGSSSLHIDLKSGEMVDTTLNRYKDKIQIVEYFENPATMSHTSATVISKEIFMGIDKNGEGFPVGMKVCEDWTCFFRIALQAPVVYVGQALGIRNNNVPGQITNSLSSEERFKLYNHVVDYYNLTYESWLDQKNKNNLYPIYLKYDIRNRILNALKDKDQNTIYYLLSNLDTRVIKNFSRLETMVYQMKSLNFISKVFIYLTKIIWHSHNFPVVGKNY